MTSFSVFIAMSLVALSTGCASIIKGTDQVLTINSEPDGALVSIDGISVGETPLSTKVKKNSASTLSVKKEGYKVQTMPLEKRYDGVALINVFWDLSTTDLVTGAAFEYVPSTFHFQLKKDDSNP